MFCPQCGRQVEDGAAFCGGCGHAFTSAGAASGTVGRVPARAMSGGASGASSAGLTSSASGGSPVEAASGASGASPAAPLRTARADAAPRVLAGCAGALLAAGAVATLVQAFGTYGSFKTDIALLAAPAVALGGAAFYVIGLVLAGLEALGAVGALRLATRKGSAGAHPVRGALAPACIALIIAGAVLAGHLVLGAADGSGDALAALAGVLGAYGGWLWWGLLILAAALVLLVAALMRRRATRRVTEAGGNHA